MFRAIVENDKLDDFWSKHCKSVKEEVLAVSTTPKPYEDVDDAYLIYQILNSK